MSDPNQTPPGPRPTWRDAAPRSVMALDLGDGLELWKCHLDDLREQDVNAQSMPKQMFDRLTKTIQGDKRLEQLPFAALTESGLQIVSGHHRTRGARAAGLTECWCLVDTTGLDRDAIAAKQLAHNSIHGSSDPQLVKRIYESIGDVNRKLESFIDPKALNIKIEPVAVKQIDVGVRFRQALIVFLPYEEAAFHEALKLLEPHLATDLSVAYMAELKQLDQFKTVVRKVGREYDVRALGTTLTKVAEIVAAYLGEPLTTIPAEGEDLVSVRDAIGTGLIPSWLAPAVRSKLKEIAGQRGDPKDLTGALAQLVGATPPTDVPIDPAAVEKLLGPNGA